MFKKNIALHLGIKKKSHFMSTRRRKNKIICFGSVNIDDILNDEEAAYFGLYDDNNTKRLVKRMEAVKSNGRDDDLSHCIYCKLKKAIFITKQTRSMDEGMSYLYKCTSPDCMRTWEIR